MAKIKNCENANCWPGCKETHRSIALLGNVECAGALGNPSADYCSLKQTKYATATRLNRCTLGAFIPEKQKPRHKFHSDVVMFPDWNISESLQ